MERGWFCGILVAVCAAGVAAAGIAAEPKTLTVDEALARMSEKTSSVGDLRASVKVTKFDSTFEETHVLRLELFYRKPDLTRVDTYKKRKGGEVHTHQVIVGKDYILRVWPENRHGERRKVGAKEMARRRADRNDPLTFFSRKPDDLKKDFNVKRVGPVKGGKFKLAVTPKNDRVGFDYESVELVVDMKTWMPASIRAMTGGKEDDWSLYEFRKVKVNSGLKESDFQPLKGIKVEEVAAGESPKPETRIIRPPSPPPKAGKP